MDSEVKRRGSGSGRKPLDQWELSRLVAHSVLPLLPSADHIASA